MERHMKMQEAISDSARAIGIHHMKPEQTRAMNSILSGKDTFVSLPTGFGKSIIFAALPMAFDQLKGNKMAIVIISTTFSLMQEHLEVL